MAGELKMTLGVAYSFGTGNANLTDDVRNETDTIDITTPMIGAGPVVTVGTSEADLVIGNVDPAINGWLFMKNLDTTNFVKYGPKSGGAMVEYGRLLPGKRAWLFLAPGVVHRWVADTAACKVKVRLYQK